MSTNIVFTIPISAAVSPGPVFTQTHYFASLNEGNYATTVSLQTQH